MPDARREPGIGVGMVFHATFIRSIGRAGELCGAQSTNFH
jgi:hypothetical protein